MLPIVAETPQRRTLGAIRERRASASSVCMPRLEPRSSCHSSTMTVRRCLNVCKDSGYESISVRLSGVMTIAVGGDCRCRSFTELEVSPVLCSSDHGTSNPRMHSSRARQVSLASARKGVIHRASNGGLASCLLRSGQCSLASGFCNQSPKGPNQAALVFPMPVLARINPWCPAQCDFQACSCQAKGD